MSLTRLGLQIPSFTFEGVSDDELFDKIAAIALTAESSGFDSLWVMDHFYQIRNVGPRTDPMFEAYTLLGALAARTSRLQLGTLVTGVTYRNPAVLAKQVTSLDVISAGRAILGIGAAWNDDEHDGYGVDFPSVRERMDRLEEALQICRLMFEKDEPSFSGRYYRINKALNVPRPVRGSIPILVGGGGEQRTLKLVAKYADACNLFGDAATVAHKLQVLSEHMAAVGREPGEVTKTRLGTLAIVENEQALEAMLQKGAAQRGVALEQWRPLVTAGTPQQVTEQVQELLEAGLDGLIFNMVGVEDLDRVALAGETLNGALR